MTLKTILHYLLGRPDAIRTIAHAKESLWIGILLVLLAGIARHYDQSFILETPARWFLGGLVFSTITGTLLYIFTIRIFERDLPEDSRSQWTSFMACYWMTAPLAFLYAIPVERFLSPLNAAKANVLLFAIVALWRVALMGRVVSVITGVGLLRAVGRIATLAAVEFTVIFFFANFGQAIQRGMMGMQNSPEEDFIYKTGQFTSAVTFWSIPILIILLRAIQSPATVTGAFRERQSLGWPKISLFFLTLICALLAIFPQIEQSKSAHLQKLFDSGQPRAALDYLALVGTNALAASRPIPPKLYEIDMYEELDAAVAALRADDPEWIRSLYLHKFQTLLSIRPGYIHREKNTEHIAHMMEATAKLPSGTNYLRANRPLILDYRSKVNRTDSETNLPPALRLENLP